MANYATELQPELAVNSCKLVTVSVDNYLNTLEHRHAVGAFWPFLCDFEREVITELDIKDVTDKRYAPVAIPYTFVLDGARKIYKIYNGWWYVGRPRTEELRQDLRALLTRQSKTASATAESPQALQPGRIFLDIELPNQDGAPLKLSALVDGWPTALIFIQGHHSPQCRRQLTNYVTNLQPDLRSGYFNLITVSVDDPLDTARLRQALGAQWAFLSDTDRTVIQALHLVDDTDDKRGQLALPFTFVLDGNLEIYKTYFGGLYVGRPTVEELRQDFRTLMARRPDWEYADQWDYQAIHSETRYELTHGLMDHFHPPEQESE